MSENVNENELHLLAAMVYGESSGKNVYEEMAGIASVLIRQRNARGYPTMMAFTSAEPSYSYVVKDGNPRYAKLMKFDQATLEEKSKDIQSAIEKNSVQQGEEEKKLVDANKNLEGGTLKEQKHFKNAATEILKHQKHLKSEASHLHENDKDVSSMKDAYRAAKNALAGGADYSNGAFFWDGSDIKKNYHSHFKVLHGIKICAPEHNIYQISDSTKLVIITRVKIIKDQTTKVKKKVSEEVGRYDHVYESTAAQGGTIFWKQNPEYMRLTGAKEYK